MDPRAQQLIERLGLEPHPEGGFFREHFRAEARVSPADGRGARAALTGIHFLLPAGQVSLGPASGGHAASCAVPAGGWQAAWPTGAFALVTCAVGPGFEFADFRLLADAPGARARIEAGLGRFAHLL
jgi:hypothetical protein